MRNHKEYFDVGSLCFCHGHSSGDVFSWLVFGVLAKRCKLSRPNPLIPVRVQYVVQR
jgi:hypothetical protein